MRFRRLVLWGALGAALIPCLLTAGTGVAAAAQVSPLAVNGQLLAFAQSSSGDMVAFARNAATGQWTGYDLSAIYGLAKTTGPVVPDSDPDYGSQPIALAPGTSGHVLEYEAPTATDSAWRVLDLSTPFGLGTMSGPIVPWTDVTYSNSLIAMAVASNGDAVTIARSTNGGAWHRYDLTTAFGLSKVSGPLLPYTDPDYGSSLIAFGTAPAGHVIQFSRQTAGGAWKQYDLTAAFGVGTVNGSGIVPYTDPNYGGSLIAFAVNDSGDVLTFARVTSSGAWNHYDLSSAFALPRTAGPVEPATDPSSGELLAFYPATNGDVIEAERNAAANGSWSASDLSAQFGLSPVSGPLIPFRDPATGQLLLFGETAGGEAVEYARAADGSWQQLAMGAVDSALRSLPAAPPAPPTPTPIPVPRGRRAVKVRIVLYWTWHGRETKLDRVRVLSRLPKHLHLALRCRGRGCPFRSRKAAGVRGVQRSLGRLQGRRFRAGDQLRVAFTRRGRTPEVALVSIRNRRVPLVRLAR